MQTTNTVSTRTLIQASLAAIVIAALALLIFILPAEYDIDPTGLGKQLGLTALATPDAVTGDPEPLTETAATKAVAETTQAITLSVPPLWELEFKVNMAQYDQLTYEWTTDGEPLYFDLHGEPKGDTTGYFKSYAITTSEQMQGSFIAPFAGTHGWYWKNTATQPVEIQLTLVGQFELIASK